ncbi:MAG: stage II sporulation protein P [Christensenellales bacterium]
MEYKGYWRQKKRLLRVTAWILLWLLFLPGCDYFKTPAAAQTDAAVTFSAQVVTPEPTMQPIIGEPGENGDVKIRQDILELISTRTYEAAPDTCILIYHTHAAEAYRQEGDYAYEESGEFRTLDNSKNVTAVGEALKKALVSYGFWVIHDTTNVEAPALESAYNRSLEVMEKYPQADIYIDLHRNAADTETKKDDVVIIDGKRCAKMFFVVGTGKGTYEGEYDVKPDWVENYRFALSVMEKIKGINPELVLPIRTKAGRYNQHVSDCCLLVEIGHNAVTLDDVLNSVPHLAKAFSEMVALIKEQN